MAFGILIIGDEILSGRHQDKHLAKSIEVLGARGLALDWARYCGDHRPRLTETLRQTFATGDIVFSFGGIGATPDDHTRQCAAAALGLDLVLHPGAAELIHQASMRRFQEAATPQRLAMGEFPLGAELIPNPYNGIPGFSVATHHFVPGFPQMAWPMMEWVLDTKYRHLQHQRDWHEEAIAVYDAQESQLVSLMNALQDRFGVTAFSLPHIARDQAQRYIELGAKGARKPVLEAMEVMRGEIARQGYRWCALHEVPEADR